MPYNSANNKRIAKNTLYLYLRSIFLLLINLYTSRVTLDVLGVDDYGIYQVVGGVVAMFSMLSSTLASASQRFITYALGEIDKTKLKSVFSTCITLHIVLGAIVVVLLEILGIWFLNTKMNIPPDRLTTAGYVMHLSIATFFVNVISVPYNAIITAHEKMSAFAYISILEGMLKLGAVFLLLLLPWDKLIVYAILYFGIAVLLRSIYSIYSAKHFEEARNVSLKVDKQQFKDMFAFSGWNFIGSSALVLRNQGIDIVLNLFFGVSVNAAKGISNQVQNAIHTLVGNFTTAVRPQLTIAIAQNDYARAHSLIIHGGKLAFFLMMLISIPFMLSCSFIMQLWLVKVPEYAIEMVSITFIYLLTDTLSRFLINSVLANGEIKAFQIILGGIKLLAVPITWIVIKCGGSPLTGIIVNTILQFCCLFGEMYFANKFVYLNIKTYFTKVVLRCWFVFSITYFTLLCLDKLTNIHPILMLILSFLLSLFMICSIGLDNSEKEMVSSIVNKTIKKI